MLDIDDNGGLICGYDVGPSGLIRGVDHRRMATALGAPEGTVWLHFNLADNRARQFLAACAWLPDDAREVLLGDGDHVQLERCGDGVTGILGDLHHDFGNDPRAIGVLRLYADAHRLITARRHPLKAIDQMRRAVGAGQGARTSLDLLLCFIENLASAVTKVVNEAAEDVEEVEDRLIVGRLGTDGSTLGQVRRLAVRLRRRIAAQRSALASLLKVLPPWCDDDDRAAMADAVERLADLGHDIELIQERARLLQEELSARLTEATNRNLYILSTVTVVMLPVTLVTGIFGMNVGGLPWASDPAGFADVALLLAAVVGMSILALKWLRVL